MDYVHYQRLSLGCSTFAFLGSRSCSWGDVVIFYSSLQGYFIRAISRLGIWVSPLYPCLSIQAVHDPDNRDIGQTVSKGMDKEEIPIPATMLRN
jgi:hypothetical protein